MGCFPGPGIIGARACGRRPSPEREPGWLCRRISRLRTADSWFPAPGEQGNSPAHPKTGTAPEPSQGGGQYSIRYLPDQTKWEHGGEEPWL